MYDYWNPWQCGVRPLSDLTKIRAGLRCKWRLRLYNTGRLFFPPVSVQTCILSRLGTRLGGCAFDRRNSWFKAVHYLCASCCQTEDRNGDRDRDRGLSTAQSALLPHLCCSIQICVWSQVAMETERCQWGPCLLLAIMPPHLNANWPPAVQKTSGPPWSLCQAGNAEFTLLVSIAVLLRPLERKKRICHYVQNTNG